MNISFVKESSSKISIDLHPTDAERLANLLADYEQHGTNPFVFAFSRKLRVKLLSSIEDSYQNLDKNHENYDG